MKEMLETLAQQYENSFFITQDPSQFLRRYSNEKEQELAGFIAAMLAFGQRTQFIPKINYIFTLADTYGGLYKWIKEKVFEQTFVCQNMQSKFYRFYSYDDMHTLFKRLSVIVNESDSLGNYIKKMWELSYSKYCDCSVSSKPLLCDVVGEVFFDCKIVPKGKNSASKRVQMFLRWMVRQNSTVDLGLWKWYSSADLIMPLDVHVMKQAVKLGLLPENSKPTKKTAIALTFQMKKIWPQDPVKADFALYGLGAIKPKDE